MATTLENFTAELQTYLTQIEDARRQGAHHDQRRHLFLRFVERAFPVKSDEIDIEKDIKGVKVRGLIDALYRDLVFEFKRDLEDERERGLVELEKYLTSPAVSGRCFGVLTDGIVFEVYALRHGKLHLIDDPVDLKALAEPDPYAVLLWFDSFLFSQKNLTPKSDDVVRKFGASSPVFLSAADGLHQMWKQLKGDSETHVKFDEWNRLLAKVYGTREVGTIDLFIRHTYLSLLAKVLAYVTLFRRRPQAERELVGIVNGDAFRRRYLVNLSEPDFFAWVLADAVRADCLTILRGFVQHLAVYDLTQIKEDLLKELYQGLVHPEMRHELGEYYTPDWLAELTLREAGYEGDGSLLDPACGSGTFLFTAVRRARQTGKQGAVLVEYAQKNIMGTDVHPLAVTTARVNYALALAPDFQGYQGTIPIPVYMADALLTDRLKPLKEQENGANSDHISIIVSEKRKQTKTKTGKTKEVVTVEAFAIPSDMARSPNLLDEVMDAMCDYARMEGNKRALAEGFRQVLVDKGISNHVLAFWMNNINLMIDLVRRGRDTIWGFILRNAYRPLFFAQRKFDFVVGNPPWLSYRYIQDKRYQMQVKDLVFAYGLLGKSDVKLFNVMDTSTLFYEFCHDRYCKADGTLAFVMPRAVLTGAKQHEAFQRMGFTRGIDLEDVAPLFNVPTCVLVRSAGKPLTANIPLLTVSGNLPARNLTWADVQNYLKLRHETYSPLQASAVVSHYYDLFVQGATIVPQSLWFVHPAPDEGLGIIDPHKPYLETDPDVKDGAKKPWDTVSISGFVESDFLYSTLLTKHLVPFGWTRLNLVVLPVRRTGSKVDMLNPDTALALGFPSLTDWLKEVEQKWKDNKKETTENTIYQWLDYRRKLTSQQMSGCYKVLHNRSGTNLVACVVDATRKESLKVAGLPSQGFVAFATIHGYETKDTNEAHYLCAVLNSDVVNEAIKPYQTRGLFGERDIYRRAFEVLPIPRYDPNDSIHRELADISQACHAKIAPLAPKMTKGSVGQQRQEVRRILSVELARINALVQKLLGNPHTTQRRRKRRSEMGALFGEEE